MPLDYSLLNQQNPEANSLLMFAGLMGVYHAVFRAFTRYIFDHLSQVNRNFYQLLIQHTINQYLRLSNILYNR